MPARNKVLHSASELVEAQIIKPERLAGLQKVAARYAVAITPALVDLIDTANPHDPIARQFVPDERELETHAQERDDPIGDEAHSPVAGCASRAHLRVITAGARRRGRAVRKNFQTIAPTLDQAARASLMSAVRSRLSRACFCPTTRASSPRQKYP